MDVAGLSQSPDRPEVVTESVSSFVKALSVRLSKRCTDDSNEILNFRNILFDDIEQKSEKLDLTHRIFTLKAATGLGKTLASMNFALRLRRRI